MFEFLMAHGQVALELARLLNVRFVPGEASALGHTGRALAQVLALNNSGNVRDRDQELVRLRFFARDLQRIEQHNQRLLEAFRTKFRDPSEGRYFGSRHEAATASSLIAKGIAFEFEAPGGPDFTIEWRGKTVGVECSSAHITTSTKSDLVYKIVAALHAKRRKPYAVPTTVLSVDVTNLFAATTAARSELFDTEKVHEAVKRSGFGSIVLTTLMANHDNDPPQLERNYIRRDSPSADPALMAFLNVAFPRKGHEVSEYSVPRLP